MTMKAKKAQPGHWGLQILNPTAAQRIPISSLPFTSNGTVILAPGTTLDFIMRQISPVGGSPGPWLQIPSSQINSSTSPVTWTFLITTTDCPTTGNYVLKVIAYVTNTATHTQSQVPSTPVTFQIV